MPGSLFVVATPIGNLEDITLRALRVLREADLIAAEDTRRTQKLLNHYDIGTPTTSLHEHNERQKVPALLERLRAGQAVALVSDAGTPAVSDPGAHLVDAALRAGFTVIPIPGASALLSLLSAAGLDLSGGFVFAGFPPNRLNARNKWLSKISREDRPVIFFEAPHRVLKTMAYALQQLGDRRLVVGRELTKTHEQLVTCTISDALRIFAEPKGEFVLILLPSPSADEASQAPPGDAEIAEEFGRLTNNEGSGRREAVSELADRFNLSSRAVYQAIERAKNRSKDQQADPFHRPRRPPP